MTLPVATDVFDEGKEFQEIPRETAFNFSSGLQRGGDSTVDSKGAAETSETITGQRYKKKLNVLLVDDVLANCKLLGTIDFCLDRQSMKSCLLQDDYFIVNSIVIMS